jgi:hypothetical protein
MIKLESVEAEFTTTLLQCPNGGEHLHHEGLVWLAGAEDKDGTRVDIVGSEVPEVTRIPCKRGEFNGRRGEMVIAFSCEDCANVVHHLQIMQHKGQTSMYWLEDEQIADVPDQAGDEQLPNHL